MPLRLPCQRHLPKVLSSVTGRESCSELTASMISLRQAHRCAKQARTKQSSIGKPAGRSMQSKPLHSLTRCGKATFLCKEKQWRESVANNKLSVFGGRLSRNRQHEHRVGHRDVPRASKRTVCLSEVQLLSSKHCV